ncbi:MAG: bifunctional diguanylate cyclase/phosphodiesterase [Pseudomonadaceae bacterium]|nr:MAG: bifunctional diguanylate cyclase/phosphodiesterase [Pseudomonadaceae bacterium]
MSLNGVTIMGQQNNRPAAADNSAKDAAFKRLFYRMPVASMLVNAADGCVIDINPAFQRLFGWAREESLGRDSGREFPLWRNKQQRELMLQHFHQHGRMDHFEAELVCRDGRLKTCVVSVEYIELDGMLCRLSMAYDITEQKRFDAELKKSQERLNMALDASQMGIWDLDLGTRTLHCSAQAAYLHGFHAYPWEGPLNYFTRSIHPQDRKAMRQAFIAICRGEQQRYKLSYRQFSQQNQPRWLEATATLHRDANGTPLRMVGTLKDITDRRRNEQALIDSEVKFATLFQGAPEPYCLLSREALGIIEINRSFTDQLGYLPEQVIGQTPEQAGLWNDQARARRLLTRLLNQDNVQGFELSVRHQQGHSITCEISTAALSINRQPCLLLSVKDISARKEAERALRASEQKFALAFKASPDSISMTEQASGRHIEVNEGFTRLTGYRAEEVIGKTAQELGIWSDYQQREEMIAELQQKGQVREREMRARGKFGQELLVTVSVQPLSLGSLDCMLVTARDITEQKLIEARIKHLAYHDALTDLPNRTLLTDRLDQSISLYKRVNLRGALMFFDLDHFKHINDSLGHSCGDAVLQAVTQRLLATVRKQDTVARLGGDEFVVLLSGLDADHAQCLQHIRSTAEKLRRALAQPMQIEGHALELSVSIGIAVLPDHGDNPEDLLKRADIALYRVKETGRNGIAFFEQAMQVAASERLSIESELRQALALGEFQLHYQPQLDAASHRIVGAEALIRWHHPKRGMISPASFIPVLEESGMILAAGQWVVAQACQQIRRLLDSNMVNTDFRLSVNISPRQFRQQEFVEHIEQAINASAIPACHLVLEITENIVIQDINDTIAKMQQLRALGVAFAIDDFGTGYSSLSYLKRLPLDTLKIDQSFVRDCTQDPNDAEIIRAIIALGLNMQLKLVAEGVEQQEQLDFLMQLSCHAYQGYLFSPALAEADFLRLLEVGK